MSQFRANNDYKTIVNILSGVVNYDTKRHRPTFHILVWRLRERQMAKLKFLIVVGKFEWFVVLIYVKILLFVDLQKWNLILSFDESNVCNDSILRDPEYIDRFCINFPYYCVLNQVDLDTNLLDNVILTKIVLRPTKKTRSLGPHKSKLEKTISKKKSCLKNKKFRSVSTQLREVSAVSNSGKENILQQRLFYTNEDLKNYPFIHTVPLF